MTENSTLSLKDLTLEELQALLAYKQKQQIYISGSKKALFCLTILMLIFSVTEGISSYRKWKKEKKRAREGAHREDTSDETHYRLKPNSSGVLSGATFHINSQGFRSPEFSLEKNEKKRIVCVGDSLTFGWGATDTETYPYLLGQKLPEIEVINGGVIGYNTQNLIRRIEEDILPLKPDLLVCLIGWNNLREYVYGNLRPVPKTTHSISDHFATSFLLKETLQRWDRSLKLSYRQAVKQTLLSKNHQRDWPFLREYKRDLQKIKTLCEQHQIPFIFISVPHFFNATLTEKDQFELLSITLGVDLSYQGWTATIEKMNQEIQSIMGADHFVSITQSVHQPQDFSDFCHPTPQANQKIVDVLAPEIQKRMKKE